MARRHELVANEDISDLLDTYDSMEDDNLDVVDLGEDVTMEVQESDTTDDDSSQDDEPPVESRSNSPPPTGSNRVTPPTTSQEGPTDTPSFDPLYEIPGRRTITAKDGTKWSKDPPSRQGIRKRKRDSDTYQAGPTPITEAASTLPEILKLFLDEQMLSDIVTHTNVFIKEIRDKVQKPTNTYSDMTLMELDALLGVLITAGARKDNHLPAEEMFSNEFGCSLYRCAMSESRFSFLMRCLKFDEETTREERKKLDRFSLIREVWDAFIQHCRENYTPGEDVTVDEQLLAFRGRCKFKMYMPKKPAKYGLKLVLACDCSTSYMFNAIPYLGKGSIKKSKEINQGQILTLKLLEDYTNTGRTVTTDNWFTSLPLANALREVSMNIVGTVKRKPYIPAIMNEVCKTRKIGTTAYLFHGDTTLVSYKAKKDKVVTLLSTLHHSIEFGHKNKSTLLLYYNKHKGGVDTCDQLCANYSCSRQTRRWTICIFLGILNIACMNSYVIHNGKCTKEGIQSLSRRDFLKKMGYELIKKWAFTRFSLPGQHFSVKTLMKQVFNFSMTSGDTPRTSEGKQQRCNICPRSKDRKTKELCRQCKKPSCKEHSNLFCVNCIDM